MLQLNRGFGNTVSFMGIGPSTFDLFLKVGMTPIGMLGGSGMTPAAFFGEGLWYSDCDHGLIVCLSFFWQADAPQ